MVSSDDRPRRLHALGAQLRDVHDGLRKDLDDLREGLATDRAGAAGKRARRLTAHCVAFCSALDRHHRGEDGSAFPVLVQEFPALAPTIDKLAEDHHLITVILRAVEDLTAADATGDDVLAELDGLAAIMESHFRFEEKTLTAALDALDPAVAASADWFGSRGR
jgi:hypothetical protein